MTWISCNTLGKSVASIPEIGRFQERKFRYNYRDLDFDEKADKIIEILMREPG